MITKRIFLFVLCLGLFSSPFIFWPSAIVPFEIPRVWFLQRFIQILGLVSLLVFFRRFKMKKVDTKLIFLVFLFVAGATISSVFGVDFNKSFWGNYYRGDGLFTLYHLAFLYLLIVIFWQENWRKYLALSISLGSFFTSIWALVSGIRLYILNDISVAYWVNNSVGVSFGQPKFLAGYLLVSLPFTVYLLKISKINSRRTFFLFSIIIQTIAIAFTKSWAGVLGVGLLVVLIILSCNNFQRKLVIVFGLLFLVIASVTVAGRLQREKGFVAESRGRIFRKVITAVLNKPILGWGWSNADYAFESVDWPIHIDHDVYVDKAHAMVLEVLATTGIIGFILYLMILGRVGQMLICPLRKSSSSNYLWCETLFLVFVLYIFHSQTNVISIAEEMIFWLIVGMSANKSTFNDRS